MAYKVRSSAESGSRLLAQPDENRASDDFERAVATHQRHLLAKALCLTRDQDDARDLVQDTLVRGMKSLSGFRPGSNMRAWLMRILVNIFVDRCRERACRPTLIPLVEDCAGGPELDGEAPPLSAQVTLDQLQTALAQLDPLFRQIYELRITRKLSYDQISRELEIPIGTVGSRLMRTRERLCEVLTEATGGREGAP